MFNYVVQDAGRGLQTEFYFLLGKLGLALGGLLPMLTSDHGFIFMFTLESLSETT